MAVEQGSAAPAAPTAAPPLVSPVTQMTPQQFAASQIAKSQSTLNQYLNYLNTNMGRVDYTAAGKTATAEFGAETSPLLAGINAAGKTGQQAITGYTSQLASNLAGIQPSIAQAYTNAEQQQAAVDSALQQSLSGAGTSQANALSDRLAQLGQNTSVAQDVAQQAQGYAGANYATGSASLSSLLAQGAAANVYGASLPGIAALAGYQATGALQNSLASERAKVIADAQKQYPTLLNQLVNQQLTNQRNVATGLRGAATAAASNAKNATGYYLTSVADAIKQQNADTSASRAATSAAQGNARIRISQQRANNTARHERVTEQQGAERIAISKQKATTRGRSLTPEQLQRYTGEISDTVGYLRSGVPATTSSSGKVTPGHPALNFADALAYMRSHGYMATPQLAAITLKYLKSVYPAAEVKIAAGSAAGPPVPSATAPPSA